MKTPPQRLGAAEVGRLEALHGHLLAICLWLEEAAADIETYAGKPGRDLAVSIPGLLDEVHDLEERVLFPDFNRTAGSCFAATATERLKAEHRCDRLAAAELSRVLSALADGRSNLALETISRMLHGFQESLRRHIHAESLLLETLLAAKTEEREIF